ncbi:putative membrane-associated kinase regulator 1 [Canna indica]|uniref:Membrane-associated kinase regulator 1 n=1 Tax=Canna indica TaxID=4628 RepID=A0AAQ3JXR0_9LILI|nr:putative membrane-associated kinase regulator 1 [Canna indica]
MTTMMMWHNLIGSHGGDVVLLSCPNKIPRSIIQVAKLINYFTAPSHSLLSQERKPPTQQLISVKARLHLLMERTSDGDGPRVSGASKAAAFPALSSFPSPSSSSSSDFEFTVSLSPASRRASHQLCPADELFYKGQLLPLHLSPRISMVRTLFLASASASSTDTGTTTSRDSNGSSSSSAFSAAELALPDCDSSRPSSVTEEEARRVSGAAKRHAGSKYLSSLATRFSSVFLHRGSKKLDPSADPNTAAPTPPPPPSPPTKRAKEVIKKYVKKVKPIYDKLSVLQQRHNQPQPPTSQQQQSKKMFSFSIRKERLLTGSGKKNALDDDHKNGRRKDMTYSCSHSFSGNLLGYPTRKKQWAASCPSSMRSSPSHSGLLYTGGAGGGFPETPPALSLSASSMEELQNAIQSAIAHCKSSMIPANPKKSPGPGSNNDIEISRSR